jgi:hypothetical protein
VALRSWLIQSKRVDPGKEKICWGMLPIIQTRPIPKRSPSHEVPNPMLFSISPTSRQYEPSSEFQPSASCKATSIAVPACVGGGLVRELAVTVALTDVTDKAPSTRQERVYGEETEAG